MDWRFFGKAAVGLPVVLCALSSVAADARFAGEGTLQAALDAGAGGKVTIAKGVWKVDPAFIRDRTEVVFEDGAELEANPEGFFGIADCVLTASNVTDVVVHGGTIRMHRQDYLDKKDGRLRSQWRHGLALRGARNVLVEDMKFYECGGDGIYITSNAGLEPSRNVTVRNTLLSRGLRQGMSVIDVEGLLLENCVFERTLGENPQAGIDFEPNSPSQRLKGVVMRGCRFSENVRKGINLHLDSLKGPSEPVDFLIENCVCVSNAIGFGLCFNSKAQSFVKGRVIVSNCLFSTSWEQGIDVTQKPLSGLQLEFHDVTVEKSCLKDPSLEEIHFEDKFVWDEPVDGVLFDRVTVRPTKGIPWFRYARHSRRKIPVRAIRGNVTVVESDGTEKTVTVTPEGIERDFPHADGAEIVPFAAPDWTAFVPPAVDGWQSFEPLELRGHLNFLFYADRARTVRFTGGLRERVQPTDRAGPLLFYSIDKPRRKLVEVPPNDDRFGSFSFDAPKAGWYILYHTPGRNGFYLTGCDAPIIFMDAERRWFKPDGTCFRLPPGKAVWGLKPLGTKGTLNLPTVFPKKPDLATGSRVWPTGTFRDGTVRGVIVSEDEDTRKLAEELKWHFDQMSGTETEIVTSVPPDVPSVVLRRGGARGESRIRREGRSLVLEGEGCGLSHAVTYLLEAMGCRYLWPGRLGKVIPRTKGIRLPEIEFSFKPTFRSRNIRLPSFAAANGELEKKLGFTHAETSAYDRLRAQAEIDRPGNRDFFAWHGVAKEDDNEGQREWGHAFGDYYQKYGKTHPDWFALQENGSRKLNLAKHPSRPAFCLSNGEFVEHAAADVIDGFRRHPDSSVRSACLPDGGDAQVCLCPSCRAMDPVDGRPIELWIRRREWRGYEPYVSLTDRTLSFYNAIAARVAEACPGKRVSGYAYSHYTEPPRSVRPHPSLVLLSVAGDYETQAGRDAVERNLAGWLSFGNEILWRPNTLIGFRMAAPQALGVLQFNDLEKAKANGVTGVDVCAVSCQWACRGFDAYLTAKGILNPDRLDAAAYADDFCRAGFGTAAPSVRRYFAALEEMSEKAAAEPEEKRTTTTGPSCMKGYVKAFDPDRLAEILNEADRQASDGDVRRRIAFLRLGLEAGRVDRAIGLKRLAGEDCSREQAAFIKVLRRMMKEDPLAVAPYWCASTFYEPHMRGFKPNADRVRSPLAVDLPRLGTLVPKSTRDIVRPTWTLGCEVLDRDFADFNSYRDYLPPLGIRRIRLQAGWAKCERKRGRFDFAWLDEIVDFARTNAIEVLMDLSYGNPIYPGGGGWDLAAGIPTSAEGLAAWDVWTEAIARHFGDRVAWWAMWNEPDNGRTNTPGQIAAFNVRTAKTLRRVLPDCRIAGLSLAHNTPEWMEGCLKPMGADARLFDAFIYHGYQQAPEASYERVAKLREIVSRYAPNAFLWQCENGAPSEMCGKFALAFTPWSELTQAKWDLRRMLGDRGHDIASSVFTICDFNHKGREMNRKGLLRANEDHEVIAVKRAYYAVQNLVSVFDGSERRVVKPRATTTDTTLVLDEYEMPGGRPLLAFWSFAEEGSQDASRQNGGEENRMLRPSDSFATRPAVFRWNGPAFEDPVWVDVLTGRVYAFPLADMIAHSRGIEFVNVPVYDSPALLTERRVLNIQ